MSHTGNKESSSATNVIRALNVILGLSQETIAQRLGVSYTTVNAWATAKSVPRNGNGRKIANS